MTCDTRSIINRQYCNRQYCKAGAQPEAHERGHVTAYNVKSISYRETNVKSVSYRDSVVKSVSYLE